MWQYQHAGQGHAYAHCRWHVLCVKPAVARDALGGDPVEFARFMTARDEAEAARAAARRAPGQPSISGFFT